MVAVMPPVWNDEAPVASTTFAVRSNRPRLMHDLRAQRDALSGNPRNRGHVVAGESPEEQWIELQGQPRLINVSQATLTPVLPAPGKVTDAAMIVAPGGGFLLLAMDKEGWNVAGAPDPVMVSGYPPAIEDGKQALRLLHARAAIWGIDPQRIGATLPVRLSLKNFRCEPGRTGHKGREENAAP